MHFLKQASDRWCIVIFFLRWLFGRPHCLSAAIARVICERGQSFNSRYALRSSAAPAVLGPRPLASLARTGAIQEYGRAPAATAFWHIAASRQRRVARTINERPVVFARFAQCGRRKLYSSFLLLAGERLLSSENFSSYECICSNRRPIDGAL